MMTIQRYSGENVEFHTTGNLVAYEDYAELKEEYERLDKSHSAALAKIDALAAENAALKAQEPKAWFIDIGDSVTTDFNEAEKWRGRPLGLLDIETPATDAILASLRAEGVEMLLASLPPYYVAKADIEKFAAQLRSKSEVQS